jgi:hypothetical protein
MRAHGNVTAAAGENPPSGNAENQMAQGSHIDCGVHVHDMAPNRIARSAPPRVRGNTR